MSLVSIKAVLFDMDGTLLKLNLDMEKVRNRLMKLYSPYNISKKFKPILEDLEEAYLELKKISKDADMINAKAYSILEEEEIKAAEKSELLPYAKETLEFLKSKKLKIGLVSMNCRNSVIKSLQIHNIRDKFDVIISRDTTVKTKPHPEPVLKALNLLGVAPKECVFIGDHPYDIESGKKAGVITIGITTGYIARVELKKSEPDYIINSLDKLGGLL